MVVGRADGDFLAVGAEGHAFDGVSVFESQNFLAGGRVPEHHGVVGTTAEDLCAVRTEGRAVDHGPWYLTAVDYVAVPLERQDNLAAGRVPHLHRVIMTA